MIYLQATISHKGIIRPKLFRLYESKFKAMGLIDSEVVVGIEKYRRQRSKAQNRYVWGVVVPILRKWHKETQGVVITKEEAYAYIRIGILGETPQITEVAGVEVVTMQGKRLSQRNTKEFAEAMDTVIAIMAERGCQIPKPREENLLTDFLTDE